LSRLKVRRKQKCKNVHRNNTMLLRISISSPKVIQLGLGNDSEKLKWRVNSAQNLAIALLITKSRNVKSAKFAKT
jgi:hypothetical protein